MHQKIFYGEAGTINTYSIFKDKEVTGYFIGVIGNYPSFTVTKNKWFVDSVSMYELYFKIKDEARYNKFYDLANYYNS